MGGLGFTSAVRSRVAAYWSSWADCIKMIKDRHLAVAETIIEGIAPDQAPCFQVVRSCERAMNDAGLDTPSWREMSESLPRRESQPEPNGPKFGWQHAANMSLEKQFHTTHWEQLPPPDRALMRSQRGPLDSAALTALPTCRATRIESQPFRVWLCRRLRLPLPLTWPQTGQVWPPSRSLLEGRGCWGREITRWSAQR